MIVFAVEAGVQVVNAPLLIDAVQVGLDANPISDGSVTTKLPSEADGSLLYNVTVKVKEMVSPTIAAD